MAILSLSEERHQALRRFRRNTWKAIALCAVLRVADAALGLGLSQSTQTLAAQDIPTCTIEKEFAS